MEIVKILIDRLISWPVAVCVVAFYFRHQLQDLIHRTTSVQAEVGGQKLAALASPPNQTATANESLLSQLGESANNLDAQTVMPSSGDHSRSEQLIAERERVKHWGVGIPSVWQREELIRAALISLDFGLSQETIDLLIRQLAYTQVSTNVERIYRLIFGSQIAALKSLNLSGGRTLDELVPYYERAGSGFLEVGSTYTAGLEGFLGYLIRQELITPPNDEKRRYTLSEFGKTFFVWLVEAGVSEEKPF